MLHANSDPASFHINGSRPSLSARLAAAKTAIENKAAAKMAKDIADSLPRNVHEETDYERLVEAVSRDMERLPGVVAFHPQRVWQRGYGENASYQMSRWYAYVRLDGGAGAGRTANTLHEAAMLAYGEAMKESGRRATAKALADAQHTPVSDATQGTLPLVKLGQGTSQTTIEEGGV